jgi:hypothetical protein
MLHLIQPNNQPQPLKGAVDQAVKASHKPNPDSISRATEKVDKEGPGFDDSVSKQVIEDQTKEFFKRYPNGGINRMTHALGVDLTG